MTRFTLSLALLLQFLLAAISYINYSRNEIGVAVVVAAPMTGRMLGVLRQGANQVRMASTVSRALTNADMASIKKGDGIVSTQGSGTGGATAVEHVADNKKPSPFISFTGNSHTSKYYAQGRPDKPKVDTPMGPMTRLEPIAEVKTKKGDLDLRSPDRRAKAFAGGTPEQIAKANGFSKKDSEVLKVNKVKNSEIVRIKPARLEDPAKTERRRQFQKNPPVDMEAKAKEAAARRAAQATKQKADTVKNKVNADRSKNKVPSAKKPQGGGKKGKGLRRAPRVPLRRRAYRTYRY